MNFRTIQTVFAMVFSIMLAIGSAYGQKQEDLSRILNKIIAINEVQEEQVGIGGVLSENYKNYLVLKSKASIQQLVKLTDDKNAVVACYAGWALIDTSYKDLPSILVKFLKKERYVTTYSGCIVSNDLVSSEFYHRYWNSIGEELRSEDKTLFTLDSLILYTNKVYWLLTFRALENRMYPMTFNNRIEYLAFTEINKDAIIYLQKLHDEKYDEQIKQALIRYFQETDFSAVGMDVYLETMKELLNYNDEKVKSIIVTRLKKDTFWKSFEKSFLEVLTTHGIQLKDVK